MSQADDVLHKIVAFRLEDMTLGSQPFRDGLQFFCQEGIVLVDMRTFIDAEQWLLEKLEHVYARMPYKRRFITWCTLHLEMSVFGTLGD